MLAMSVQKPAKDHHHTPRSYLARWAPPADKDGRLWYYRREYGKLIEGRIGPKGTGYEEHLYTARPTTKFETRREDQIETDVMSPLDDGAAKVLENLTASRPLKLETDERRAWARFLNSLLERHPRELNANDDKARKVAAERMAHWRATFGKGSNAERANHALDLLLLDNMATTIVRQHMLTRINDQTVLDYLVNQQWTVCGAIPGEQFITSDRPVLVDAQDCQKRPIHFLSIALSPAHLFVSHPKDLNTEPTERDIWLRELVADHNCLLVLTQPHYLYSAARIVDSARVPLRTLVETTFGIAVPTT